MTALHDVLERNSSGLLQLESEQVGQRGLRALPQPGSPLDRGPGQRQADRPPLKLLAAVHKDRLNLSCLTARLQELRESGQRPEVLGSDCGARLGFYQHQSHTCVDHEIHFQAARLPEVVNCGSVARVYAQLDNLRGDPALKDRSAERMVPQLIRAVDAQAGYTPGPCRRSATWVA